MYLKKYEKKNKKQNYGYQNNLFEFLENADLVLSNKLVIYDIENQTIGWTEYNCE